jgi:hypothetical protein
MPTKWVSPSLLLHRSEGPSVLIEHATAGRVDILPADGSGGRLLSSNLHPSAIVAGSVRRNTAGDKFIVLGAAGEVWVVHEPAAGPERTLAQPIAKCVSSTDYYSRLL